MAKRDINVVDDLIETREQTLLDVVDELLNKGVVADGDVTLGVAGIDLIYLRLSALLCAANRVLPRDPLAPSAVETSRAGPAKAGEQAKAATAPDGAGVHRRRGSAKPLRAAPRAAAELRALRRWLEQRLATPATVAGRQAARYCGRRKRGAAPLRGIRSRMMSRSIAQLVLTIVEFLRQLMERRAIRRMERRR
jgi:hypothetical protein